MGEEAASTDVEVNDGPPCPLCGGPYPWMLRGESFPTVFRAFECDHSVKLYIPGYKGVLERQTESFLQEHARRESLPRQVCPTCWHEFSEEDDPHGCNGV